MPRAAAAALALLAGAAGAAWPERPVRLLVGLAPGGGVDATARALAVRLSAALGQPVVVDNRPGAGGSIAAALAARSAPDGHTLLLGSRSNFVVDPLLNRTAGYDPQRDLAPVSLATAQSMVLIVHPAVPARSVAELIALARAQPRGLAYASGGTGTGTHLAGELFARMAGVAVVHVPYKGGAQSMVDLIAGHVQFVFQSLPAALPHARTQRVRALAVSGARRSPLLPELPTVAEAALPGFDADNWYGLAVAARTPPALIARLNAAVVAALNAAELRQSLANQGLEPAPSTPAAFAAHLAAERARWGRLVVEIGLAPP